MAKQETTDKADKLGVQGPLSTDPKPAVSTPDVNQSKDEKGLTDEQIVLRRTAGDDWPLDGKFRRVFNIAGARVSNPKREKATASWNADEYDSMHRANYVAVLQEAINRGLHPRGEVYLEDATDLDEDGQASLTYAVEVVPASSERPEEAAQAYTPSAAIADMGGDTLAPADRDAK